MSSFATLRGAVFVASPATEDDRFDGGEHRYGKVVFVGDAVALRFTVNGGGYFKLTPDSFVEDGDQTYFYPYHNETTVRVGVSVDTTELTLLRDDVVLQAIPTNDGLFIRSQNEVPAYTPNYLVVNETLYRINTEMFTVSSQQSPADDFLGLDSVEEPVYVENMNTGATVPLPDEKVRTLVENDDPNGALKVYEPNDLMREVRESLTES